MIFASPWVLFFLFALIPLAVFQGWRCFKGPAALEKKNLRLRRFLSDSLFLLFVGFLILSLAGPTWGFRYVPEYRRGLDLVLAMDLSRSMLVEDCPGNSPGASPEDRVSRFERGRLLAREVAAELDGIRMGIALGKEEGILAIPLTWDSGAVQTFLDVLDESFLSGKGTNLEHLVDAAAGAFQEESPGRRCILLLSDGEGHAGSLQAAIERAENQDIRVSIAGLGSNGGGPVPGLEETVISSRRENLLKRLAEGSGGIYVDGNGNDSVSSLVREFHSFSTEGGPGNRRREPFPRWRIFLLGALVSLGLSRILRLTRRTPEPFRFSKPSLHKNIKDTSLLGGNLGMFCILSCLLFSGCQGVQGKLLILEANFFASRGMYPEAIAAYLHALEYPQAAPYGNYGLGSVYAGLEEEDAALERYQAAEEEALALGRDAHGELLYRLYYNKGGILFEKEDYDAAASAFRSALEVDGSRTEAKRNLELSLLSRERPDNRRNGSFQDNSSGGEGTSALFDYLRRKEEDQWRKEEGLRWIQEGKAGGEWTGKGNYSGPDY